MVSIKVDGLPVEKAEANVFARPATAAEFEAVVEAVGGPAAFSGSGANGFVTAQVEGGTVFLFPPADLGAEKRRATPQEEFLHGFTVKLEMARAAARDEG